MPQGQADTFENTVFTSQCAYVSDGKLMVDKSLLLQINVYKDTVELAKEIYILSDSMKFAGVPLMTVM